MTKYYLIEEYTEYDDRPGGSNWKAYDVRTYATTEELKEAILQGSKHNGKLMPAKGLELKLELVDLPDNSELARKTPKYCMDPDVRCK